MRLIYHPDAEAELIEAARFYESRVSSLGAEFLDAADQAVALILDAPDRWSIIEEDVRRYLTGSGAHLVPGDVTHPRFTAGKPPPRL